LAPEFPFPAAVDDAYKAYRWLLKQGIQQKQIVVGGSSAGGGLAAALLAKLKIKGESQPAAAVLLSPLTDLMQSAETSVSNADSDPTISKVYLDRMAGLYLNGADPRDPLASPVFSDLTGLPPMLVQVGTSETMLGDAQANVDKARQQGVQIQFDTFDDVPHGWHNSAHVIPDIPEALAAIEIIGTYFKSLSCE
jgi:epsilon-lactone hydrolase